MAGTPIQLGPDGAVNLHPDGAVILAPEGEACCCGGEPLFVRARDCCDRLAIAFWVPVGVCCARTGEPAWAPGRRVVFRLDWPPGHVCLGIDADAPVRDRAGIVRDFPDDNNQVLDTFAGAGPGCPDGAIECVAGCGDPACPECPPCCTYSLSTPGVCGNVEPCLACGASWVFSIEIDLEDRIDHEPLLGGFTTTGSGGVPNIPDGWRDPDCVWVPPFQPDATYADWITGHPAIPALRRTLRVRAGVVRVCDPQGRASYSCSMDHRDAIDRWDLLTVEAPTFPPRFGDGYVQGPLQRQIIEAHECRSPEVVTFLASIRGILALGDDFEPGIAPHWLCNLRPAAVLEWLGGTGLGSFQPQECSGGQDPFRDCDGSCARLVVDPMTNESPCRRVLAQSLGADRTGQSLTWSASRGPGGGHLDLTARMERGAWERRVTARWTMTTLVPCPPGASPCGEPGPGLLTALDLLTAYASVPRV